MPASFFAYEPVLRCLQEMETIPLAEELLHGQRQSVDYLPEMLKIPPMPWATDKEGQTIITETVHAAEV